MATAGRSRWLLGQMTSNASKKMEQSRRSFTLDLSIDLKKCSCISVLSGLVHFAEGLKSNEVQL